MAKIVNADILVVGSGSAGLQTAIKGSELGVNVLVITKGLLSRSGCSRMSGTHWGPHDLKRVALTDAYHLGTHLRLVDHQILHSILEYSPKAVRDLENMGIVWNRTPEGEISESILGYPNAWKTGETGMRLMDILYSETLRREINFMEETMATSLLTKDGKCVGATALDYRKGDFFVIRAKSVVLATGHVGYQYRYSTQSREVTGDGISMAYRCGAELINLEFQHWHHSDLQYPESARRFVHSVPTFTERYLGKTSFRKLGIPAEAATVIDEKGTAVIEELKHLAATDDTFHSPDVQRNIAKRYGKRGGLFMHYNKAVLESGALSKYYYYYPVLTNFWSLKEPIPLGTSAHTHAGGVRINERCETTVPGLYAAGGVSGIYPTVNTCLWAGETSSKHASERAKTIDLPELDWEQVNREEKRVKFFLRMRSANGFAPPQVKRKIRDLMWEKMWIIKTEAGMKEALEEVVEIRENIVPRMGLKSRVRTCNFGWAEALDVESMLIVCELVIRASLARKESRGSFYVEEHPKQDDENWLKNVVIKLENGRPKVNVVQAVNIGPPLE